MDIRHAIDLIESVSLIETKVPDDTLANAAKDLLDNYLSEPSGIEAMIDDYRCNWLYDENEDDEVDVDTIAEMPEFKRFCDAWADEAVSNAAWEIEQKIAGDHIVCWRMITATADWKPSQQHPGLYWSWERGAADAHWGGFDSDQIKFLMQAKIPLSSIDWVVTIAANAHPDYANEKEIRIYDDAPVLNLRAKRLS